MRDMDVIKAAAQALISYAIRCGLIEEADRRWAYNELLDACGIEAVAPDHAWEIGVDEFDPDAFDLDATLAVLADAAIGAGRFEDSSGGRDRAAMAVMGRLMPRPSQVAAEFARRSQAGSATATDWFYRLCCDAGYVRRSAIARNIAWTTPTRWGDLEITINLSKPEKDPRDIAAALSCPADVEPYPACQLCMSNEGYAGRAAASALGAHPARQNLRIVPIELGGRALGPAI